MHRSYEHAMKVEVSIDRDDEALSNHAFQVLETHRSGIEGVFGQPLASEILLGRKRCRIKRDRVLWRLPRF